MQLSEPTSPVQPMREEGEVSYQESALTEQNLDQQSEEQTYRVTIRGIRSFTVEASARV